VQYDAEFFVSLLARWLHILAAITAVGGTIFARYALLASLKELPDDERKALHERIRRRWSKAVMAAIGFLLLSGIYNFVIILQGPLADAEKFKPIYHALFGVKFLLALAVFFIASALVGRSAAFDGMRANARKWLTINVVLAVLIVCISGFLRLSRDQMKAESGQPSVVSQRGEWVRLEAEV